MITNSQLTRFGISSLTLVIILAAYIDAQGQGGWDLSAGSSKPARKGQFKSGQLRAC